MFKFWGWSSPCSVLRANAAGSKRQEAGCPSSPRSHRTINWKVVSSRPWMESNGKSCLTLVAPHLWNFLSGRKRRHRQLQPEGESRWQQEGLSTETTQFSLTVVPCQCCEFRPWIVSILNAVKMKDLLQFVLERHEWTFVLLLFFSIITGCGVASGAFDCKWRDIKLNKTSERNTTFGAVGFSYMLS